MLVLYDNPAYELAESLPADWPEAQEYLQLAVPLQMGAMNHADMETLYLDGKYRVFLARRKSDAAVVACVLVQVSGSPKGLLGIFHFLFANEDYRDYAAEFVLQIKAALSDEPMQCIDFLGMARKPFLDLFMAANRFSLGVHIIPFGYQWPDP